MEGLRALGIRGNAEVERREARGRNLRKVGDLVFNEVLRRSV